VRPAGAVRSRLVRAAKEGRAPHHVWLALGRARRGGPFPFPFAGRRSRGTGDGCAVSRCAAA
jgi:hypothetical protein